MMTFLNKFRRYAVRSALLLAMGIIAIAGWVKMTARPPAKRSLAFHDIAHHSVKQTGGMVRIPAGRLPLGSHLAVSPVERPLPTLAVEMFWMDATEVTNRQFAEFVAATQYVTTAEHEGVSNVFDTRKHRWRQTKGADWRHPTGPNSSIAGRENFPVVQVSWSDAAAYAHWAGKRLPTEYEWEYAARGGLYDAEYPWGRSETPSGAYRANAWQGWFPDTDRGADGFTDLAPVSSYPANAYGLSDMAGNVWEWCADRFDPRPENQLESIGRTNELTRRESPHRRSSDEIGEFPPARRRDEGSFAADEGHTQSDQSAGSLAERRIRRGGSWLCCENYSLGLKLSTRSSMPESARSNHVGFRCVSDEPTISPLETASGASRSMSPAVK